MRYDRRALTGLVVKRANIICFIYYGFLHIFPYVTVITNFAVTIFAIKKWSVDITSMGAAGGPPLVYPSKRKKVGIQSNMRSSNKF